MAEAKNMSGHGAWIKFNVVLRSLPQVARIAQQIMHLVRLMGGEPQPLQPEFYPAGVCMVGIEVHHHHDHVSSVLGVFAITEELVIIGIVKL
jgi:hypothetical protein